jgi:hypothetical protein
MVVQKTTCSLTLDAHLGEFALRTPLRCDGCVYVLIERRARGVKCLALLKRKPEIILLQAREALAGWLLSAKTRPAAQAVGGSSVCMPRRKQVQATLSRRRITERDLK